MVGPLTLVACRECGEAWLTRDLAVACCAPGGDPDDRRAQADYERKAVKEQRDDDDETGDPRMDYDEARDFARGEETE